jgi:hypothetical protein
MLVFFEKCSIVGFSRFEEVVKQDPADQKISEDEGK